MTYQASIQIIPAGPRDSGATIWQRLRRAVLSMKSGSAKRGSTPEALERAIYSNAYREEARRRVDSLLW